MSWPRILAVVVGVPALLAVGYHWWLVAPGAGAPRELDDPPPVSSESAVPEASAEQVHAFCGACHAYPAPDTFPRAAWRREVRQGYDFFRESGLKLTPPPFEAVARYYERRAPSALPAPARAPVPDSSPISFARTGQLIPGQVLAPAVTHVAVASLGGRTSPDVLVCDARRGAVLAFRPTYPQTPWRVLGHVQAPARAAVVDLDGDGRQDLLVANLGSFPPTDYPVGSVVWLRGQADGTFTPVTLLEGVGRVADAQAADFNGDGKLDLVVAVFGWRGTGEILYLENRTTHWSRPLFEPRVLDGRHGTIQVPVCDLNGDGRPDFVALISQEHETVVAFLNEGGGRFRKEIIYTAPHPAYGSSSIQVVDLDGDGDLDVLYSNGDVMDRPSLLKPYHGVQWLENRGGYPFTHHPLTPLYGVQCAVAADLDGDGDMDVVAVSYLPPEEFPRRADDAHDAVIWLEQTGPGLFRRHTLETRDCDHFTAAVGDVFADGRAHLITGNFALTRGHGVTDAVALWKNLGRR